MRFLIKNKSNGLYYLAPEQGTTPFKDKAFIYTPNILNQRDCKGIKKVLAKHTKSLVLVLLNQ